MLSTIFKSSDHSSTISDQNNSHLMDDFVNDLEAGIAYNPPRNSNKKMKKRKQLDALHKFRSLTTRSNRGSNRLSNDALLTSEDELFLPDQKKSPTKSQPSSYRRWCSYTRHILSFCLVCIFMIVCVGLAYANIELKNEVHNLSFRVTEIEKRFSNFEINRILSTIEQIKSRLNLIERWNGSYIYDQLQKLQTEFQHINTPLTEVPMNDEDISSKLKNIEHKSTQFSEVADELDKLSRDADNQATNIINGKTKPYDKTLIEHLLEQERQTNVNQDTNQLSKNILSFNESLYESTVKWHKELDALRNEFQNLNQTFKIQELDLHFEQLTHLVMNSSDKTSAVIIKLQSDLDKLRNQIEACKCPKEPWHLKPSVVDSNQLQQSIVTKPNTANAVTTSPTTTTATTIVSKEVNSEQKQSDQNNTIDIAQLLNQPSINA